MVPSSGSTQLSAHNLALTSSQLGMEERENEKKEIQVYAKIEMHTEERLSA